MEPRLPKYSIESLTYKFILSVYRPGWGLLLISNMIVTVIDCDNWYDYHSIYTYLVIH